MPIRTCITCGMKREKRDLIRIALNMHNQLVKDISGKMKSRGAYVCPSKSCQEGLLKNNRLNRIFRTSGEITLDLLFK
ncbi:MAG: YlxR family protein [Deltaproteobacteria bacterium]|nr:YlxR family protein [Deltaproteobacteria bacterium]